MYIKRIILAMSVAVTSTLFVVPAAAEAKPARTPWNKTYVEVTENLPSSWDVKGAVADLDWYTGSSIRIVKKCSKKVPCVNIRSGNVPKSRNAISYFSGCYITKYDSRCTITVDLKKAARTGQFGYKTKRWLVRHELGHFRGLRHNSSCATTMNPRQRCRGSVPPNAFTTAERKTLVKK